MATVSDPLKTGHSSSSCSDSSHEIVFVAANIADRVGVVVVDPVWMVVGETGRGYKSIQVDWKSDRHLARNNKIRENNPGPAAAGGGEYSLSLHVSVCCCAYSTIDRNQTNHHHHHRHYHHPVLFLLCRLC